MKVSIIIPVYNKEEYLPFCIESLRNQIYKDIEIILVDDESKDKSGNICDEYADKDPRVISIHQKNTGAAGAWRTGFKQATGRYVLFVDADDWIDNDAIERMMSYVTDRDDEMVISDFVIEKQGGKVYQYQALEPGEYNREEIIDRIIPSMWGYERRYIHMSRCMKLISRKLVGDNEHYSRQGLRFGEDNALALPCVMDCGRLVSMDHAAMYHYRYVNNSVVHNYDKTLMSSITLLQKLTLEMIDDKFKAIDNGSYADKLSERIWLEWPYLLIYAVKNEIRGNRNNYISEIKKICLDPENRKMIFNPEIKVEQMSNRLIYFVMKHPTAVNCRMLRFVMEHY